MRTDSTLLSEDSNTDIGNYIERNFGKVYLSAEIIQYKSKIKNAQEAHEAIRPTPLKIIWRRSYHLKLHLSTIYFGKKPPPPS